MFSKKRAKKPRSLSFRLTSRFTTLLVLSHLFFLLAIAFVLKQGLADKDRNLVHARFNEIAAILSNEGLEHLTKTLNSEDELKDNYHLLVRVLDTEKQILYDQMPQRLKNFSQKEIDYRLKMAEDHAGKSVINPRVFGEETIELMSHKVLDKYILIVGFCTEESEDFMGTFFKSALIVALFSILISVLFGYWYSRQALMPIRSLITSIQEIQSGSTKTLVPESGSQDELTDLIEIFNKMILQINQLISSLQQSLDAIAHDLRTPITHLTNRFEAAIRSDGSTVSKEFVHECLEEVQGITSLLTTLLEISEVEAGSVQIKKTHFNIERLFEECVELYEFVAEEKNATFTITCQEILISADRNRLKRILANLIDNALKYADRGVHIELSAAEAEQHWLIRVKDNGWGISRTEQKEIWQRLFRGDTSRSSPGMGLGLSFVKSIIELHGGQIVVHSELGRGSVFEIILPKDSTVKASIETLI